MRLCSIIKHRLRFAGATSLTSHSFDFIVYFLAANGNYEKWHRKSVNRDALNGIIFISYQQ